MAELLARDTFSSQRWRRRLVPHQPLVIGRATPTFPVSWDKQISSRHAHLVWNGVQLEVRQIEEAVNPIFFQTRPRIAFVMDPGQHFVIGHTEFLLDTAEPSMPAVPRGPQTEVSIRPEDIRQASFRKVRGRIELLTELVSKLTSSTDDEQLITLTLQQLLRGIPHATDVLLLERQGAEAQYVPVAWDSRDGISTPQGVSRTLVQHAIESQLCVVHVWAAPGTSQFTEVPGHDWAMCVPLQIRLHQQAALYISGRRAMLEGNLTEVETLQDDIKYAELVGSTFANLSRNLALERRQLQLNRFFSPGLIERVPSDLETFLAPREAELMVLFCDLRGFSAAAEAHVDQLIPYLHQTSETLSQITAAILAHQGVIGDFHGDAVMGFWGWPSPEVQRPEACFLAAQEIARQLTLPELLADAANPVAGIGIAAGSGVAGMIGSRDQVKVTAFGPPVNLAARIEGLTKWLKIPLLLDEAAVTILRQNPACQHSFLRIGRFHLAGLQNRTDVFAVDTTDRSWTSHYTRALEKFEQAEWPEAERLLAELPESFGPAQALRQWIAQCQRVPPVGWDRAIQRQMK